MDDISKTPRLPGDGAQDDTHFQETSKANKLGSTHSTSIKSFSDATQSIEG